MTKRNIVVTEATDQWIEDLPVEIVERKGIGHPDSLCDGIAERISVEYSAGARTNLGAPLHHNFDKVQLVAGEVRMSTTVVGSLLKPIRIQIAGRGTPVLPRGARCRWTTSPSRQPNSTSARPCDTWTPDKHW